MNRPTAPNLYEAIKWLEERWELGLKLHQIPHDGSDLSKVVEEINYELREKPPAFVLQEYEMHHREGFLNGFKAALNCVELSSHKDVNASKAKLLQVMTMFVEQTIAPWMMKADTDFGHLPRNFPHVSREDFSRYDDTVN